MKIVGKNKISLSSAGGINLSKTIICGNVFTYHLPLSCPRIVSIDTAFFAHGAIVTAAITGITFCPSLFHCLHNRVGPLLAQWLLLFVGASAIHL